MPEEFRVDVEELSGFATRLDECTSEKGAADQQMDRIGDGARQTVLSIVPRTIPPAA
ncbi:hypothetical protein ACTWJ8_32925 [Streptomyces sp. SDT5-1]|uniref:hypothetical protein n=1 Tax=Streptomyces sp. SDT5-1 TaxID=3406418 RepID=UPI003FD23468